MVDNYAICSTVALLTKNLKILCKILIQEYLTRKKNTLCVDSFCIVNPRNDHFLHIKNTQSECRKT